jgi:hypothetical protein
MCVIHAPEQVLNAFTRMKSIDAIMWNRAGQWDRGNIDLKTTNLVILYAVSGIKMDPTRKSVRDPNLFDESYSSESIFSPKKIFTPLLFRNNLRNVNSWILESTQTPEVITTNKSGSFLKYSDVDDNSFLKLLDMFDVDGTFEGNKLSALELLNSSEANYGLSHLPKYIFISQSLFGMKVASLDDVAKIASNSIGRSSTGRNRNFNSWYQDYSKSVNVPNRWSPLSSPHIGGAQRALYSGLNTDCVFLIIEPIKAWQIGDESKPFALGLAASVIVPKQFKIRTIGFR